MKKTLVVSVVAVVALLSAWFAMNQSPESPYSEEEIGTPIVQPEPTPLLTPSTGRSVDTGQLAATLEATLGTAQTSAQADDPASEGAVVEGIVRNQAGAPVADATIHIAEKPTQDDVLGKPPVAHTGSDGRFRVTGVNPDVQAVFADHPDYAPGWVGMNPSLDEVVQLDILLTRGGTIEGRVTLGGEPQASAYVSAWLDASAYGARTDTQGKYQIPRVPPGEWFVGLILKDDTGIQREAKQSVPVVEGGTSSLNFDLPMPDAELAGIVTILGEIPSTGYLRFAVTTPQGFEEERTVKIEDSGKYVVPRTFGGPANLVVVAFDANRREYRRPVAVTLSGGEVTIKDIDIVPGSGVLTGSVIRDGSASRGVVLLLRGEFDPPEFTLYELAEVDSLMVGKSDDLDQPFVFKELEAGTYTLLALIQPDEADLANTTELLANALVDLQTVTLAEGEEQVIDLYPASTP